MESTKQRRSPRSSSHPFPFFGSGVAAYVVSATLVIWFETEPGADELALILAKLPAATRGTATLHGPALHLESTGDMPLGDIDLEGLDDVGPEEEERLRRTAEDAARQLAADTEHALRQVHADHRIRFAIKELAEASHELDAWHGWSLKQRSVVDALSAPDAPLTALAVVAPLLAPYFVGDQRKLLRSVRLTLLTRLEETMQRDDPDARKHVPLYAELLEELPTRQRRQRTTALPPRYQIALANDSQAAFEDLLRMDSLPVVLALRERRPASRESVVDDLLSLSERVSNHVMKLTVDKKRERRTGLELAAATIEVAESFGAAIDAVADRRLTVYSLQGRLDECIPLLRTERLDDYTSTAVGVALAVATRESHRRLLDACLETVRGCSALLHNPIIVANVLPELLAASRFAEASALAVAHLERGGGMTPVLSTNALLAFASADERGPLAEQLAARVEALLEDSPTYFQDDGPTKKDLRGSAHAWLGLWYARNGNVDALLRHMKAARSLAYADLEVLEKHPAVTPLLVNDDVRELFAVETDSAIAEKTRRIRQNPSDWWAVFSRGLLHHERGDIARAEADYKRTIELNPSYPDVYINVGNIFWTRDKNFAEAVRWYDKALDLAKDQLTARLNRAEAKLHLGDARGALADSIHALGLDAKLAQPHFLAALAYAAVGDRASAHAHARTGHAIDGRMSGIDLPAWREELETLASA